MNHNSPLSAYTLTDSTGTTVQTTDYYPYGLPMATSTGAAVNPYKYAGTRSVSKPFERSRENEFETGLGLNFHDFEARMLFNDRTLFSRPDPQAAKYPHLNPYLYCAANPLRYTDPTGCVVKINGRGVSSFVNQLQAKAGNSIKLLTNGDNLTYLYNSPLSQEASLIANTIDDPLVTVSINCTTDWKTATPNGAEMSFIGGAFLGNKLENDAGGKKVSAAQAVNSNVLEKIGKITDNEGGEALHELTEAYQGAKNAQESGIDSSKDTNAYEKAHNAAYPQKAVITQRIHANNGRIYRSENEMPDGIRVTKRTWFIKNEYGDPILIQRAP